MPCMSDGPTFSDDPVLARRIDRLEAMLCAVIKTVGFEQILKSIDYTAGGFSPAEFRSWWEEHQARDEAKRKRDAAIAADDELRATARAKLTPDERRALGIR